MLHSSSEALGRGGDGGWLGEATAGAGRLGLRGSAGHGFCLLVRGVYLGGNDGLVEVPRWDGPQGARGQRRLGTRDLGRAGYLWDSIRVADLELHRPAR